MMALRRICLAAAVAMALVVTGAANQRPIAIKLGTLAPANSVWHQLLMQMGGEWRKASGGRVTLTVFAGGTQGDEDAMIRRMRINQLQAASLTVLGLAKIDEAFNVFSIPLFYETHEELLHVMKQLTPDMEKRLEAKGFVLLSWGYGGWIQVFSRTPVRTLDEMKRVRIFTSAGDDRMVQWYRSHGFNPTALATTDMMTSLQTGQVDAIPSTPLAMLTLQWYSVAPNMLDLGLAPLVGAQLVTTRAWSGVPEDARAALVEAARTVERQLVLRLPADDQKAIAEMEKRGLKVTKVRGTPAAADFEAAARTYGDSMRGTWVPPEVFDHAVRERDAFRARAKSAR
jgi:TRAP-type C4-dicarboxylate transport system substrate-binding protein